MAQIKSSPYPHSLRTALSHSSFSETEACFRRFCLNRVKMLETIAFQCIDLPGKENAMIENDGWQGVMSDPIHVCPSCVCSSGLRVSSSHTEWNLSKPSCCDSCLTRPGVQRFQLTALTRRFTS